MLQARYLVDNLFEKKLSAVRDLMSTPSLCLVNMAKVLKQLNHIIMRQSTRKGSSTTEEEDFCLPNTPLKYCKCM